MDRKRGFTLVELLVVIAIISILAAIVVPNVSGWIDSANKAKAVSEVKNIELALTKVLSDAGRSDMTQLFEQDAADKLKGVVRDEEGKVAGQIPPDLRHNSRVLYSLLRLGREADDIGLQEDVRRKLGSFYMDAPLDPWKTQYTFVPGPWRSNSSIPFRCYRPGEVDRFDETYIPEDHAYQYTEETRLLEEQRRPGNPKADAPDKVTGNRVYGFPAPKDLPFYVWSFGANKVDDQSWYHLDMTTLPELGYEGGGDDINSWDNEAGWETFYG